MKTETIEKQSAAAAVAGGNTEHRRIELGLIAASPTNPRKTFNAEGLQELAESIRQVGILQPLLVRPKITGAASGKNATSGYELIAGERRWRAAKLAGLGAVPCVVRELADDQVLELQLIENLQREDVSALEEAEGFRKLIDAGAYTAETLAAKLGKSRSHVFGRLRLVNMDPLIKKAMEKGDIDASAAQLLTQVKDKEELANLVKYEAPQMSYRELKAEVQRTYRQLKDARFDTSADKLVAGCPSCSDCPKRSGNLDPKDKSPNVCTDTECFLKKDAAELERQTRRAAELGIKFIDAAKEFYQGKPGYGFENKYKVFSDTVPYDKQKRTWAQVVDAWAKEVEKKSGKRPGEIMVRLWSDQGKTCDVYPAAAAEKAAEAIVIKVPHTRGMNHNYDADNKRYQERQRQQEARRKLLEKITAGAREKILAAVTAAKVDKKFWQLLAGLTHQYMDKKVTGATETELRVGLVASKIKYAVDYSGNWTDEFELAAEFAGVDLKALEKAAVSAAAPSGAAKGAKAKAVKGAKKKAARSASRATPKKKGKA